MFSFCINDKTETILRQQFHSEILKHLNYILSSSWPRPWPTWSLTFLTWLPTWPNLALADLVTNLTKLSLNLDKSGPEVDTIIKQTTPPPPPLNFSKVETWPAYSLTTQNFKGKNWIDTIIKLATTHYFGPIELDLEAGNLVVISCENIKHLPFTITLKCKIIHILKCA